MPQELVLQTGGRFSESVHAVRKSGDDATHRRKKVTSNLAVSKIELITAR